MKNFLTKLVANKVAIGSVIVSVGCIVGINPDVLRAVTGLLNVVF